MTDERLIIKYNRIVQIFDKNLRIINVGSKIPVIIIVLIVIYYKRNYQIPFVGPELVIEDLPPSVFHGRTPRKVCIPGVFIYSFYSF